MNVLCIDGEEEGPELSSMLGLSVDFGNFVGIFEGIGDGVVKLSSTLGLCVDSEKFVGS